MCTMCRGCDTESPWILGTESDASTSGYNEMLRDCLSES